MEFDLLDGYLLDGKPPKGDVIQTLLRERPGGAAAAPYYEGFKMLGPRTPDLALIALRLVLAGKKADDAAVKRLREHITKAKSDAPDAGSAREAYRRELSE